MRPLRVALCGNPNVGKSTVFNALTGMRQHTGNWAGKTVESARGTVRAGEREWTLSDLPGAYSLLCGSPEEVVASDYLAYEPLDAAVAVCDATCLERSLNLAWQAAQLCPRTVVCVNLMDEAQKQGVRIDLCELEKRLGLPVVGVSAGRGQGLERLKQRVTEIALGPVADRPAVSYGEGLDAALDEIAPTLCRALPTLSAQTARFAALRLLSGGEDALSSALRRAGPDAPGEARNALVAALARARQGGLNAENIVTQVVARGYRAAESACRAAVEKPERSARREKQLRLDRVLCGKSVGVPLMLLLLALVFAITLWGANLPSAWLGEKLLGLEPALYRLLARAGAPEWIALALTQGLYRVMAWVVSVMLPPMAIFFPLFTLMEDFGFLPRVAFNLDKCFERCQACGKQALCMCIGLLRLSRSPKRQSIR